MSWNCRLQVADEAMQLTRRCRTLLVAVLAVCAVAVCPAFAADPATNPYRELIYNKVLEAESAQQIVVRGNGDWLFFVPELRAVTIGEFWGPGASKVSRASQMKFADPLEPIIEFHQQLKQEGIQLLVVPVPAKVANSPEALIPDLENDRSTARIDTSHAKFYQILRDHGVHVLDLQPAFAKQRQNGSLYCHTDSHWSSHGIEVAANAIASQVKNLPFLSQVPDRFQLDSRSIRITPKKLEITGDLALLANEKDPRREIVDLTEVAIRVGDKFEVISTDPTSPLLLLGDSHTLVFHDPSLFATGCGLADHLSRALEIKLDLIGVRGSGANAARISWRRRPDPLVGKKLVIWCFSLREFTENPDGWRTIPVKPAK